MADAIYCPKCDCEYTLCYSEEDRGPKTCKGCGFEFFVELEYEPSYYTSCITHEWGEVLEAGTDSAHRTCNHCGSVMMEPRDA